MNSDDTDLEDMNMFFGAEYYTFRNAHHNKQNMTPAEKIFWEAVKDNQLGFKVRRQHPIGNYIADFYCHKYKLVIELDGAYHLDKNQKKYDAFRTLEMQRFNVSVLRISNDMVVNNLEMAIDQVLDFIKGIDGNR